LRFRLWPSLSWLATVAVWLEDGSWSRGMTPLLTPAVPEAVCPKTWPCVVAVLVATREVLGVLLPPRPALLLRLEESFTPETNILTALLNLCSKRKS